MASISHDHPLPAASEEGAALATDTDDELGLVYDPRCRAANAIIVLCRAALEANPNLIAAERQRYETLIEEAEAVLMLGDILSARLAEEEAQGNA